VIVGVVVLIVLIVLAMYFTSDKDTGVDAEANVKSFDDCLKFPGSENGLTGNSTFCTTPGGKTFSVPAPFN